MITTKPYRLKKKKVYKRTCIFLDSLCQVWIESDGLYLPSLSKRRPAQWFLSLSSAAAWCQPLPMSQHLRLALSPFPVLTPVLVVTCFACTASSQAASLRWSLPRPDLLLCFRTLPRAEAVLGLYAAVEGTAREEPRLSHPGWKALVSYELCLRARIGKICWP